MKLLINTNVILDMVLNRSGCNISMELFRKVKEIRASIYNSLYCDRYFLYHSQRKITG